MSIRVPFIGLVTLFLIFPSVTRAQQQPEPSSLPDTPPPKQDAAHAPQEPEKKSTLGPLGVIARRSYFYPDLATTPGPLTSPEKFELFLTTSISTSRLLSSTASAGINQARNAPAGYHQGSDGYAKRFGSSMASAASSNLFGAFLVPSLLHQDPRYFVHYNATFGQRVKFALRRMVITRTDDGGEGYNWSGIVGPLLAESLANTYLPDHERTAAKTFGRSGVRIGITAANNLLKEYWPAIFKNLRIDKVAPGLQPVSPADTPPASQKAGH